MIFRLLRSRPCRHSCLSGAFFILCALAAAPPAKTEAGYDFTGIIDSAGIFSDFSEPSLNASGTAAFLGALDSGEAGIFSGNGGAITTVAVAPLTAFGYPTIDDAGTVALFASPISGNESVFAGNGGPLVTIADTAGQFKGIAGGYSTSINAGAPMSNAPRTIFSPKGWRILAGGEASPRAGTTGFIGVSQTRPGGTMELDGTRTVPSSLRDGFTFDVGPVVALADSLHHRLISSTPPA